jgi:hypothetical protein
MTASTTSVPASADQKSFDVRFMEDPFRLAVRFMA